MCICTRYSRANQVRASICDSIAFIPIKPNMSRAMRVCDIDGDTLAYYRPLRILVDEDVL